VSSTAPEPEDEGEPEVALSRGQLIPNQIWSPLENSEFYLPPELFSISLCVSGRKFSVLGHFPSQVKCIFPGQI
jgi:hypothetical protein